MIFLCYKKIFCQYRKIICLEKVFCIYWLRFLPQTQKALPIFGESGKKLFFHQPYKEGLKQALYGVINTYMQQLQQVPIFYGWQIYVIIFALVFAFVIRWFGFIIDELTKFFDRLTKLFKAIERWLKSFWWRKK